jgi:hypothetical protein
MKAKKLLNKASITAIQAKITDIDGGGCRHGIIISQSDIFSAVSILRRAGIEYSIASKNDLPR